MAILLLTLLAIVSLRMIFWGISRPDRIFQFPMLAGGAWLFYIVPRALGTINNPALLPEAALEDGGLEMALIMSILCALLSFVGYLKKPSQPPEQSTLVEYSNKRLFIGGILLLLPAYGGFHQLAQLSGGYAKYYSVSGNYALEWSGLPVIYVFFVMLFYPAIMLCLMAVLREPSVVRWIFVVLGSIVPLANVVFLGRRSQLVFLLLIFGMVFYFERRWAPSRTMTFVAIVLGAIMIVVAPSYRTHSQIGADRSNIGRINVSEEVGAVVEGKDYNEFHVPVVQLPAIQEQLEFGFGSAFYNAIIQDWVPRTLVGEEFKRALFLPAPDITNHINEKYNWSVPYGSNPTGIAQAFCEFWYFGAFIFYLIGRGFRLLWQRAESGNLDAIIFYIALAPLAMTTIVGSILQIPTQIIYSVVFLGPILMFVKQRSV